jgi:two-component system, cell cycle response regulator DivK
MDKNLNNHHAPLILVAEDDPISFLYQAKILKGMGCNVLHAKNGQIALDLLAENPEVDLVMMDVNMPVMDGIEATLKIKKQTNPPPVVMVTAYNTIDVKRKTEHANCDGFLTKPIDNKKYAEAILRYTQSTGDVKKG